MLAIGNGDGPGTGTLDCAIKLAQQYDRRLCHGRHSSARGGARASRKTSTNCERLARDPKVIAWGEIGLDYFYDHSPRDVQQRVFVQQMEMARAAKLPIIIHCRPSDNSENAWDDLLRLIREHWASSGLGGVLHCFTGTVEHARAALDLGFVISFAGNITYPKAQNIRDAAAHGAARSHVHRDGLVPTLRRCRIAASATSRRIVVEAARQIGELRGRLAGRSWPANSQNFLQLLSACAIRLRCHVHSHSAGLAQFRRNARLSCYT